MSKPTVTLSVAALEAIKYINQLEKELADAKRDYASLYECLDEKGVSLAEARGLHETL